MPSHSICLPPLPGLLAALLISTAALGHEGHDSPEPPRPAKPAEVYRPIPMPDRICLSWTGDPATTMSVTWRTDPSVSKAVAEYAPATDGPDFREQVERVDATSQDLRSDLSEAKYHEASFTNLTPERKYLYRVGDGTG